MKLVYKIFLLILLIGGNAFSVVASASASPASDSSCDEYWRGVHRRGRRYWRGVLREVDPRVEVYFAEGCYFIQSKHFSGDRVVDGLSSLPSERLIDLYKIHLMPKFGEGNLERLLKSIIQKAKDDKNFGSLIFSIKIHETAGKELYFSRSSGKIFPLVVIYPSEKKEKVQKLANDLDDLFVGVPALKFNDLKRSQQDTFLAGIVSKELGVDEYDTGVLEEVERQRELLLSKNIPIVPRYNMKFTDLIYYTQGEGDNKGSSALRSKFSEEYNFAVYKDGFIPGVSSSTYLLMHEDRAALVEDLDLLLLRLQDQLALLKGKK